MVVVVVVVEHENNNSIYFDDGVIKWIGPFSPLVVSGIYLPIRFQVNDPGVPSLFLTAQKS